LLANDNERKTCVLIGFNEGLLISVEWDKSCNKFGEKSHSVKMGSAPIMLTKINSEKKDCNLILISYEIINCPKIFVHREADCMCWNIGKLTTIPSPFLVLRLSFVENQSWNH
jgi:hypothetical protein